ncbi:L,D-transpeptidase family protein [Candidiatus Paracoxiella cheracis]|uniref:L,D-transpeptidase family protein n=1 Tax=Candidiatus Paracoxiella cheracis TaxID=3405120 RepID=UPI003BF47747
MHITVNIPAQTMTVYDNDRIVRRYLVSTGLNGVGELINSEKTPRGLHVIRAKIGGGCPENTVFVERRPTGEIFSPDLKLKFPHRDWILTRILWLSGLEVGKNRLGPVDTMRRYVYIHGSPDEAVMGKPGSRGCIRMHNPDVIELFDLINIGDQIFIDERK